MVEGYKTMRTILSEHSFFIIIDLVKIYIIKEILNYSSLQRSSKDNLIYMNLFMYNSDSKKLVTRRAPFLSIK